MPGRCRGGDSWVLLFPKHNINRTTLSDVCLGRRCFFIFSMFSTQHNRAKRNVKKIEMWRCILIRWSFREKISIYCKVSVHQILFFSFLTPPSFTKSMNAPKLCCFFNAFFIILGYMRWLLCPLIYRPDRNNRYKMGSSRVHFILLGITRIKNTNWSSLYRNTSSFSHLSSPLYTQH